jgi:hypothetical protein
VTYVQVAAHPALHRRRTENRRTLVIFDEIHHAGDALSWGEAVREAFEPARRRMGLTGTPFRSDANPIPFVTYVEDADGARRSPSGGGTGVGTGSARETLAALRKELSGLIAARHHRTGQPHGVIHAELRRACGGPAVPEATAEQVRARIAMLRRWAGPGR